MKALLISLTVVLATGQSPADDLVRQLAALPAAIQPGLRRPPSEERREAIYVQLRSLGAAAIPALTRGLADADVQIRRNVALYLSWEGGNYAKHAPEPLDLKPFLTALVTALRDADQRVRELSAQAIEHVGPTAVVAVPELVRMLDDPEEGIRNSACIGLAGIGPAAREALPRLRLALSDPSSDVRGFAQRAINKIDPRNAVQPRLVWSAVLTFG